MFSSYLSSGLPAEIQKFIEDNQINIVNPWGQAGGGADFVFSFLFKGATLDVVGCAYSNLEADNRFNESQKKELKNIILKLFEAGVYTVRPDHDEIIKPRPGR